MSKYNYKRRESSVARAGNVGIGGSNPIRIQSMCNTNTNDTDASAAQALRIAEAGGELVRLTTQGVKEASNMANIKKAILDAGCDVPLVADVHFNPKAAFEAATTCDKVRINPGNFVDAARTFQKLEFTDEEYAQELEKIRSKFVPFLNICKENGTCVRLGVNHGSLSDRIMSRYGDTPAGMVESVMEFLRIAREENFDNIVISVKASNVTVMVETVRLLVKAMEGEGMHFPLHLGVTEAGDGEDGRIKSAVGIGTLLSEGIGDTIRVSLSEDPECEIPVAVKLRDYIASRAGHDPIPEPDTILPGNPRDHAMPFYGKEVSHGREVSQPLVTRSNEFPVMGLDFDLQPDWHYVTTANTPQLYSDDLPIVLTTSSDNRPGAFMSWIDRFVAIGGKNPVIVMMGFLTTDLETLQIEAAADFGPLLLDGYASGIAIVASEKFTRDEVNSVALGILQATRLRISKTEYIACPGCGRTLFDLQKTLAEVKANTAHLKGLKIGVMGCIVNGPGEMADADYGYVGAGPGRVSIYKGKQLVKKNIPAAEALPALLALISESN
ncbi:MAG: (E)-4-hydroxy-3-methylbut-2-enyl-diphosphate synthase [Muribaculaceae bacterium]|nr:(E)-4-hydroxy-3-methylbut-2-enyl-diphosphate synthase [Muribaculaceae bacterium]